MPKKICPNVEETEASMEEFLEATQKGTPLYVEKIVAHPDGTKESIMLYGSKDDLYIPQALRGNPEALLHLSESHIAREEPDARMAFELGLRAALLGNGEAMRNVGICYQFGIGCMGNMRRAVGWYKKSVSVLDDSELRAKAEHFEYMLRPVEEDYEGDDSYGSLTREQQAFLNQIDANAGLDLPAALAAIEEELQTVGGGPGVPDNFLHMMGRLQAAAEYEAHLCEEGVLSRLPLDENPGFDVNDYPRICYMSTRGDAEALELRNFLESREFETFLTEMRMLELSAE